MRAPYAAGREGFLTVLDAEHSLASAESAPAASDGLLATERIQLFLALGGDGGDGG